METLMTISKLFSNKYLPEILSYYNKQTDIKNAMYKRATLHTESQSRSRERRERLLSSLLNMLGTRKICYVSPKSKKCEE